VMPSWPAISAYPARSLAAMPRRVVRRRMSPRRASRCRGGNPVVFRTPTIASSSSMAERVAKARPRRTARTTPVRETNPAPTRARPPRRRPSMPVVRSAAAPTRRTSPDAVLAPTTLFWASRTSSTMTCPSAVIAMSRASGLVEVEVLRGVERLLLRLLRLPDDGAGLADDEGAGERLGEGRRPLCRGELGEGAEEGVLARLGPGDQPLPHRLLHPRAHPCRRGERAGAGVLHQAPLDSRLLPHRLRHVHTGGDVDFGTEGVEDGEARVGRS